MSIPVPPPGQEKQNRKILEQLEEQKKRLRMQTQQQAPGTSSVSPSVASVSTPQANASNSVAANTSSLSESQHMNAAQRAALQHAHANSVGYFITQDSAFGNLILPVLPRFDK